MVNIQTTMGKKKTFFMCKSTISMAMFNSYVSLTEGREVGFMGVISIVNGIIIDQFITGGAHIVEMKQGRWWLGGGDFG